MTSIITDIKEELLKGIISFNNNTFYDKSYSVIIKEGLDIFKNLPGFIYASLFLLEPIEFDFYLKYSTTPSKEEINNQFQKLAENGAIADVLNSGEILNKQLNKGKNEKTNFLLIPLIVSTGVSGIILLLLENKVEDDSIIDLCKVHSNFLAHLINQFDLILEIENLKKVTEQKIALKTENIVRSTRELKHILDSVQAGIIIVDKKTNLIADLNLSACRLIGGDKEQIAGTLVQDHFYFLENNTIRNNNLIEQEALLKTMSGDLIPIIRTSKNITLENSDYIIESFMDISERKRMEEELQAAHFELEQKVETRTAELSKANENLQIEIRERIKAEEELLKLYWAVEQSPNPVIITDLNGVIEYVNPSFSEITGYKFENAVGNTPRILRSGEVIEDVYKELWNNITRGIPFKSEFLNKKKNGELFWASVSISPIRNVEGEITHFLSIQEDITERKQIEQEIIKAKEKAEQSNRLKTSLLANMSHEFRTPLIGILGYSQIMGDTVADTDQLEMIQKIQLSGQRLLNTLNGVLNLSQLETKDIKLTLVKTDLVILTKAIIRKFEKNAQIKKLSLIFIPKKEYIFSEIDVELYQRILSNIIDNAIKFTESGSVTVEIDAMNNAKNCRAEISITDSGIGIPEEYQNIVFDAFRQVSEGYDRNFEGSGLGLTISKKIIDLLGGRLELQSKPNVGSTFKILLPVTCDNDVPAKRVKRENKKLKTNDTEKKLSEVEKLRILVVEDNPANSDVISIFLKNKYSVDIAHNGKDALEKVEKNIYHLILMDINLGPGMDGLDVSKKIKENPSYSNIPIIAVTGYAMFGDKNKFLSQGFIDYLAKPFDDNQLLELISKHI